MTTWVIADPPVLSIWNGSPPKVVAPMSPPGLMATVAAPGPGGTTTPGLRAMVKPTKPSAAFVVCSIVDVPVGPAVVSTRKAIDEAWSTPVTV